jgi:hypothetical protein
VTPGEVLLGITLIVHYVVSVNHTSQSSGRVLSFFLLII